MIPAGPEKKGKNMTTVPISEETAARWRAVAASSGMDPEELLLILLDQQEAEAAEPLSEAEITAVRAGIEEMEAGKMISLEDFIQECETRRLERARAGAETAR
jgi:hypothetical protein